MKCPMFKLCALISKHCHFLFGAHHHRSSLGLINFIPAQSSTRMTTPLSFFPTRQLCTSIAFPYQIASSATFSTYNDRQRIGHLRVFCAPARAMHLSSVQCRTEKCVVVRERTVTHFKKEWEKILEQCEVPEPFWSVKWIVEHVLRKHPNSEVPLSLSLSPSLSTSPCL